MKCGQTIHLNSLFLNFQTNVLHIYPLAKFINKNKFTAHLLLLRLMGYHPLTCVASPQVKQIEKSFLFLHLLRVEPDVRLRLEGDHPGRESHLALLARHVAALDGRREVEEAEREINFVQCVLPRMYRVTHQVDY